MFGSTERVAFYIGSYPVMKYGITIGIAMFTSVFLLLQIRKKHYPHISEDDILDLSVRLIIAGIIGARLWFVLLNFDYFSVHLSEILMINKGGISIQGAIMGGVAAGLIFVTKKNLKFLELADMIALVLPIGQAIGRWGNFFNSEAFGLPCNLPWKLYIPEDARPVAYQNTEFFHPTFLYESIANIFIFFILYFVIRKLFKENDGVVFFSYLILYSFVRFFIEIIRTDSVLNIGNIPIASIVCFIFSIIGSVGLFQILKKND